MKIPLSILLFLASGLGCIAQEDTTTIISVIEQSNFLVDAKFRNNLDSLKSYKTSLRPLFEKRQDDWHTIDNLPGQFQFYRGDQPPLASDTGVLVSRQKNLKRRDRYDGLYTIPPIDYSLPTLKSIGIDPARLFFESNDILAFKFVTNRPLPVKRAEFSKSNPDILNKAALVDSIKAKANRLISQRWSSPRDIAYWQKYVADYCARIKTFKIVRCFKDKVGNSIFSVELPNDPWYIIGGSLSITKLRQDNGLPLKLYFVVRPNNEIKLFFADMYLIEHGDYDNNGKDEYLFLYSIYNYSYGYVLFYDDFNKYASYTWNYH